MKIIINEDAESRSQHKAINYLMNEFGIPKDSAELYVRNTIRKTFKILQGHRKLGKFTMGITRLMLTSGSNASVTDFLDIFLNVINHNEEIYNALDDNFNGYSLNELKNEYKDEIDYYISEREDEELANLEKAGRDNKYKVVRIGSFEEASKFKKYVSWCICQEIRYYNDYTEDGSVFYFLLRDGYTKEDRNKYPKPTNDDSYALSMIAVSINPETGDIKACNTRRNRDLVGNDHQYDWVDISKMIGTNIKKLIMDSEKEHYVNPLLDCYLIYHKEDDVFEFTDNVGTKDINNILKSINNKFYIEGVTNNASSYEQLIQLKKGKYITFAQTIMDLMKRNTKYYDIMAEAINAYYFARIYDVFTWVKQFLEDKFYYSCDLDYTSSEINGANIHTMSKIEMEIEVDRDSYIDDDGDFDKYKFDSEVKTLKKLLRNMSKLCGTYGDYADHYDYGKYVFILAGSDEYTILNTSKVYEAMLKVKEWLMKTYENN